MCKFFQADSVEEKGKMQKKNKNRRSKKKIITSTSVKSVEEVSLSLKEHLLYGMITSQESKGLPLNRIYPDYHTCIESLKTKELITYFVHKQKEVYISNKFINWERFKIQSGMKRFKKLCKDKIWIKWSSKRSNKCNESSNNTRMIGIIERICRHLGCKIPYGLSHIIFGYLYRKEFLNVHLHSKSVFQTYNDLFGGLVIESKVKCKQKYSHSSSDDGVLGIFSNSIVNNGVISAKGCGGSQNENRVTWKKDKLYSGTSNFGIYGGGIIIIHCNTLINNGSINADGQSSNNKKVFSSITRGKPDGSRNTAVWSFATSKSRNQTKDQVCGGSILIVCKTLMNINGRITCDGDNCGKILIYCDELLIQNGRIKGYTYMEGSYLNGLKLLNAINRYPRMYINPIGIYNEMEYTGEELKDHIFTDDDYKPYQRIALYAHFGKHSFDEGIIIKNTKKYVRIHWIGKHKKLDATFNKKYFNDMINLGKACLMNDVRYRKIRV